MLWKERLPGHPLSSEHARNNKKKVKLNCEELPDLRFGYLFISVQGSKFRVLGYILVQRSAVWYDYTVLNFGDGKNVNRKYSVLLGKYVIGI